LTKNKNECQPKQKKYMNNMEFNVGTKIYGTWASASGAGGAVPPPPPGFLYMVQDICTVVQI